MEASQMVEPGQSNPSSPVEQPYHSSHSASSTASAVPPTLPSTILQIPLAAARTRPNPTSPGLPTEQPAIPANVTPGVPSTSSMDEDEPCDEDEYDSDESFLDSMVEDLSTPSSEELARIQQSEQLSALDHAHWEARTATRLDDPEYRSQGWGRLSWTLEGYHGTPEAPNKSRVLRSPATEINGFKWSIKVFPRGSEGTDHVSVFVECLGPAESNKSAHCNESTVDFNDVTAPQGTTQCSWEVAAQIGCVMYNPEEPRVLKFDKSTHQYQHRSRDCGWVRFYGPWRTLHCRRREQLRPMLVKDRVSFTAYIRTIEDPTRALYWHPSDYNLWNNLEKTGLRGLDCLGPKGNAVVAALAPWFHLLPFRRLLLEAPSPSPQNEPQKEPWLLFNALQTALYLKHQEDPSNVSLSPIERILEWYLGLSATTDVIEIWETLRSLLNEEYYRGHGAEDRCPDVMYFLKTFRITNSLDRSKDGSINSLQHKSSTQYYITEMMRKDQEMYMEWGGYANTKSPGHLPQVLQLELPRQHFDVQKLEWKRLTHKIRIDDCVRVATAQYRLFGIIVSKGKLGSGKTYAIVRSSHIGSQWVRYRSGTVTYLTRRQAIDTHEGHGAARTGSESVAQVVIYIREDALSEVLGTKLAVGRVPVAPVDIPPPLCLPLNLPQRAVVVVHYPSSFIGYQGLGILQPYRIHADNETELVISDEFTRDSCVEDVATYLDGKFIDSKSGNKHICSFVDWYQHKHGSFASSLRRNSKAKLFALPGYPRVHVWARAAAASVEVKEIFLKKFDMCEQGPRLVGVTSVVPASSKQTLREAFHCSNMMLSEGAYVIYTERPSGYELQRTKLTLNSVVSDAQIAEPRILIIARTQHDPTEYFQGLRNRQHWAYRQPIFHRSYFGGSYMRVECTNGLMTGEGTKVTVTGNYYRGSFRNGLFHGQGTMRYAGENDTYTGAWIDGQRSGQGKMVYGRTGNVYEGGWRNGRRYGFGTMTYKQADEELQLCQICYSNDIDAVFYRCGHILACESCAKRCSECPVCRRPVDAVVKFFDMRRVGV